MLSLSWAPVYGSYHIGLPQNLACSLDSLTAVIGIFAGFSSGCIFLSFGWVWRLDISQDSYMPYIDLMLPVIRTTRP